MKSPLPSARIFVSGAPDVTFPTMNSRYSFLLIIVICSAALSVGCGDNDQSRSDPTQLTALRAVPDPIDGGRIVDAAGREVTLRGVNVNSFAEYWEVDPEFPTVRPFTETDADMIAGLGWNLVRLVLSWSLVEPQPGQYDDAYLDTIAGVIALLKDRGIYTIIDLHQDAWGPGLAAPSATECPEGGLPAVGWDGAPEWATLDEGESRCLRTDLSQREFSPAVLKAFEAFWADRPGLDGVGIQTRFHAMVEYLVERFAADNSIAGYNVMNEPNAWADALLKIVKPDRDPDEDQRQALANFYERSLAAVRAAEARIGAPARLFLFEPSPDWAQEIFPAVPLPFEHDDQVVYAPHIYQGGIVSTPLTYGSFQKARDEAAMFGGAPVLTGEWGTAPRRATTDPADGFECSAPHQDETDYFSCHQAFQDEFGIHATLWQWSVGCGDPHYAQDILNGTPVSREDLWGLFEVDCATGEDLGFRDELADKLRRPLLRAAPGTITSMDWSAAVNSIYASGEGATANQELWLFLPGAADRENVQVTGLSNVRYVDATGGGEFFIANADGGAWTLSLEVQ